jgi:hypothetical protein
MKIRLIQTPPVAREHGLKTGLVIEALRNPHDLRDKTTWVRAPGTGELVRLWDREFEMFKKGKP